MNDEQTERAIRSLETIASSLALLTRAVIGDGPHPVAMTSYTGYGVPRRPIFELLNDILTNQGFVNGNLASLSGMLQQINTTLAAPNTKVIELLETANKILVDQAETLKQV